MFGVQAFRYDTAEIRQFWHFLCLLLNSHIASMCHREVLLVTNNASQTFSSPFTIPYASRYLSFFYSTPHNMCLNDQPHLNNHHASPISFCLGSGVGEASVLLRCYWWSASLHNHIFLPFDEYHHICQLMLVRGKGKSISSFENFFLL
jgi:hypothetical protein